MEMVSRDVLPQLMDWLTLGHFALSVILIFSYWNLKVRNVTIDIHQCMFFNYCVEIRQILYLAKPKIFEIDTK